MDGKTILFATFVSRFADILNLFIYFILFVFEIQVSLYFLVSLHIDWKLIFHCYTVISCKTFCSFYPVACNICKTIVSTYIRICGL